MSDSLCPKCETVIDRSMMGGLCPACVSAMLWEEEEPEPTRIGPYELEVQIAAGGNGIVFRARHLEMGRTVALKLLRAGPLASAAELARFRAEVEALSRFGHPNLVPVFEVGRQDERPWFTMPWYPAGALRISGPWSAEAAATLVAKVARAVHYAHVHGVLHRDLKPGNILMDEEGEPHVADFGLAKWLDFESTSELTVAGSALGTPGYMAPEQAAGDPARVAAAADVFGLGAVLYHLLTGRPPFTGENLLEVIRHTTDSEPPRPSALVPGIDRDVETICLKALEKNPASRYSSALALAEDLDRRLQHLPVLARRSSSLERFRKWIRRRPTVAALSGLAVLIFAAGVAGIGWQWRRATLLAEGSQNLARRESAARTTAEARELAARRARYAADMNLCQQALATHNLGRARRLLDVHRPQAGTADLRGWEWRWLWQQCRSDECVVAGNTGGIVRSVALSPDGRRAAVLTRQEREQVELWDLEKHERLAVVSADARPGQVAFNPDGTLFAAPASKSVKLCSAEDARVIHTLTLPASPRAIAWSLDGRWIAALDGDGRVLVWEAATRAVVCSFSITRVTANFGGAMCFLPGEPARLACGAGAGLISIVSLVDGTVLREIPAHATNCVTTLAVSPDGRLLASGAAYDDFLVRVWNTETGEPVASLPGHRSWVAQVAFLKGGKRLVSCGADHTIRLWDAEAWAEAQVLRGHLHEVWGLSLTPDARLLATADKNGTLLMWKPEEIRPVPAGFDFPQEVTKAVSAGDRVLTWNEAADASVSLYSRRWEEEERLPRIHGKKTYLQPGGVLAHWQGDTQVRLAADPTDLRSTTAEANTPPALPESSTTFGSWFLCMGKSGAPILGDLRRESLLTELPLVAGVMHGPFFLHRAGKVAAWDARGDLWRWSIADRQWAGPWRPPVMASRWTMSSDGSWFAAATGRTVFLASTDPNSPSVRLPLHANASALALSPSDRWLAVSDELGTVRLWDVLDPARPPMELRGHLNAVHRLVFTPDSTRLVTLCSHAEAARFWAADTGEELITLDGPPEITHAEFACGGDVLLVRSSAGWHAWRAPSMAEIEAARPDATW